MDLRLEKNNSYALGFANAALILQAITLKEFNKWAESVVMATDDYPMYILDLCVFEGSPKDIYRVFGFVPSSDLTESQAIALEGIADLRGFNRFEPSPTKVEAAKALAKHPEVMCRFKTEFPFIHLPESKKA